MNRFGTNNFLAGVLVGATLAVLAPLAASDLAAGNGNSQSRDGMQSVNRAAKSDRLSPPVRVKQDADSGKPAKIPVGCDPAFSPLTRNAKNFSSRCLA